MTRCRHGMGGTVRAIGMSCALLIGGGVAATSAGELAPPAMPANQIMAPSGDWWPVSTENDALATYLRRSPPALKPAAASFASGDWWPAEATNSYAEAPAMPANVADAAPRTQRK